MWPVKSDLHSHLSLSLSPSAPSAGGMHGGGEGGGAAGVLVSLQAAAAGPARVSAQAPQTGHQRLLFTTYTAAAARITSSQPC